MDSFREGPLTMQAAVLPSRAVYLIAKGSRSGFIRAVQEATGRWGGMTEPIVPVATDGSVNHRLIRMLAFADAQAAVNIDIDPVVAQKAAEALGLPLLSLDQAASMATCPPSAVRTPRQLPMQMGRGLRLADLQPQYVHAAADQPLWHIAALGCPAEASLLVSRPAIGGDDVWRTQLGRSALLCLTTEQLGEYHRLQPAEACAVAWITDPESLDDSLAFWNVRALSPLDSLAFPLVLFTSDVLYWQQAAGQLGSFISRSGHSNVAIVSRSLMPEQLDELAGAMDLVPAGTVPSGDAPEGPGHALTYRTDLDPAEWVRHERSYGMLADFDVHVLSGRPTLMRVPSPVVFQEHGGTLLRIFGEPLDGLPQRKEVAELVGLQAEWRSRGLQVAVSAGPYWSFELNFPTLLDATRALLKATASSYALSQPGRLATALQGQADMRLLLDPGVYECADTLTTPRSQKLRRELEDAVAEQDAQRAELVEIASRWGGRAERRFLPARQVPLPQSMALEALEKLCVMGWAERGLQSTCPDGCRTTAFHPMPQASHQPVCPACQSPVTYTGESGNLSVVYRLNGLVDRAADHGVLPHLLVIEALTRDKPQSYFLPGTDLVLDGEATTPEVDIFGVWGGKVLAGEVKTSASDFDSEQLERDVKLSKRLGADIHLLASLDVVPTHTVGQARTLCWREGLKLVVYDRGQLRPEAPEDGRADTAAEAFQHLNAAVSALSADLQKNPSRTARKSGLFLKTALDPRSPSGGQVAALEALITKYGADLIAPLSGVQLALGGLLRDGEDSEA
ncbi:hypothetical protein [Streptacidiphilus sp. P02-A3a]|uniref:hypothetical protein n=1 Tax=Streptacidiphilus sp. P02-A3a TaxID=2704468 RepID=UPI0015FDB157|nr:hypothetical protein [Streptacidiphilus sp. P02-A3a]QMU68348.1 hypothetical protein GXP74_09020 [Streptacidiphilus sp. P02-A3a]